MAMDGWVEDMDMEGVAGVEKNLVLAAERAPLMKNVRIAKPLESCP